MQAYCTRVVLVAVPVECALELAVANTFAPVLMRVTVEALSSAFGFAEDTFILSCASALSVNKSLKSKMVGRVQSFYTVCRDQASFMLGGSFCTA